MGEKFTTQRATKVSAGGFPVAVGCQRTIKLKVFPLAGTRNISTSFISHFGFV